MACWGCEVRPCRVQRSLGCFLHRTACWCDIAVEEQLQADYLMIWLLCMAIIG
jgi:hypothetical protein